MSATARRFAEGARARLRADDSMRDAVLLLQEEVRPCLRDDVATLFWSAVTMAYVFGARDALVREGKS